MTTLLTMAICTNSQGCRLLVAVLCLISCGTGYLSLACYGQNVESKEDKNAIRRAAAEYSTGRYQAIVDRLKNSENVEDLYYLGLAYERLGDPSKAADALKRSFLKAYNNVAIQIKDSFKLTKGSDLRTRLIELERESAVGASAAQKAYDLKASIFSGNEFRLKATILKDVVALLETEAEIETPSDKVTSPKVTYRPNLVTPGVTRRNEMPMRPFKVKLLVVFGSDGAVKLAFPVDGVIDAFTFAAVSNAKGVKFEPATRSNAAVAFLTQTQFEYYWY